MYHPSLAQGFLPTESTTPGPCMRASEAWDGTRREWLQILNGYNNGVEGDGNKFIKQEKSERVSDISFLPSFLLFLDKVSSVFS